MAVDYIIKMGFGNMCSINGVSSGVNHVKRELGERYGTCAFLYLNIRIRDHCYSKWYISLGFGLVWNVLR